MPDPASIEQILEPYIRATIITPDDHVGAVMELCQSRRGSHVDMHYLSPTRVQIRYDLPLAEIVLDFFDQLKSRARATPRSTTSRSATSPPTWSSSTCCSPATRWTRSP